MDLEHNLALEVWRPLEHKIWQADAEQVQSPSHSVPVVDVVACTEVLPS